MKIRFSLSTAVLSALVFTACNQETTAPASAPQPAKVVVEADTSVRAELFEDPHSYSREESKVTHLNWEAAVDFENEVITATATWTLEEGHGDTVIFDIKDLQVNEVLVDGNRALFTIEGDDPLLGSALVVSAQGAQTISILYKTSGFFFLEPQACLKESERENGDRLSGRCQGSQKQFHESSAFTRRDAYCTISFLWET